MMIFTSDHVREGGRYRVTDPGDDVRVARVEYERDGEWRDCPSAKTRWIAHAIVHGKPPAYCSHPAAAAKIRALAAAARIEP